MLVQGSTNPQTPASENKRIKICINSCLQQAEERNFFTSFSRNLGFVDLPIPVLCRALVKPDLVVGQVSLLVHPEAEEVREFPAASAAGMD